MSSRPKGATPQALRNLTEEGRRQIAVTLTNAALRILVTVQEDTGETRSQVIQRLIISDAARKEGHQEGNDEMRTRMTELLAVG